MDGGKKQGSHISCSDMDGFSSSAERDKNRKGNKVSQEALRKRGQVHDGCDGSERGG